MASIYDISSYIELSQCILRTSESLEPNSWTNEIRGDALGLTPYLVNQIKAAAARLLVTAEILLLAALGIAIARLNRKAMFVLERSSKNSTESSY